MKKAALQMSVQSIIVFVLAFIVLGILIALIQGMFDPLKTQIKRLPLSVDLGVEPTVDRPIVVENGDLKLDYGKPSPIRFALYYNGIDLDGDDAEDSLTSEDMNAFISFKITRCKGFGKSLYDSSNNPQKLPEIQGEYFLDKEIKPGDSIVLETNIKENRMDRGDYTCRIEAYYHKSSDDDGVKIAVSTFRLSVQ